MKKLESKLFEVRDRQTFIPILAVRMYSEHEAEAYLIRRGGFGWKQATGGMRDGPFILVTKVASYANGSTWDPSLWGNDRTMRVAHQHLYGYWETLSSGDVLDVEYILEEVPFPKQSERLDA